MLRSLRLMSKTSVGILTTGLEKKNRIAKQQLDFSRDSSVTVKSTFFS